MTGMLIPDGKKESGSCALATGRRGGFKQVMVACVAVMFGAVVALMTTASAAPPTCAPLAPGGPMFITDECVDPQFDKPYVDIDEMRTDPVPHRYRHGGFIGTNARFSFYFPPAEQYQRRFFEGPTHQSYTNETASAGDIQFALASGAYLVRTNMGGGGGGGADRGEDRAYRINAAAAKFSRVKAAEIYGAHRPYGYLHGPSGGAFQTVGGLENTTVWDGGVPTVMGSLNAVPNTYTARTHALRILRMNNRFPTIMDAIDPGGSGDMYAGLNVEERKALEEVTRMGFPPRGWWNHATLGPGAFLSVIGYIWLWDPTYVDDFWSKPGYLGTDPTSSIHAARIVQQTTVTAKLTNPNRLQLATFPTGEATFPGNLFAIDLKIESGPAAGQILRAPSIDAAARTVTVPAASVAFYDRVQVGDRVALDNSAFSAAQTLHRHQVGTPDLNFYPWDQFRRRDGTPIYPQRDVVIGPRHVFENSRASQNGKFHGKMIVLEALMDIDALPWAADWYQSRVKKHLGNKLNDHFRVYFHDHAQHGNPVGNAANARTVSRTGALEQALRDLSAWVEKGVPPPPSTTYKVVDSQVEVPPTAAERKGIQPVVTLTANGGARADVAVGQAVTFSATIEVPPGTGKVVAAEWDFPGVGTYPVPAEIGSIGPAVNLTATHAYSQAGTYFAVLRATSQREGDPNTPFGRVQNIARVRVVVR